MPCGQAAVVQTVAMTAIDQFLTAWALASFFRAVSQAYAVFATDFCNVALTQGSLTNSATATTSSNCTIERRGDMMAKAFFTCTAPAILNCSASACDRGGHTGTQTGTATEKFRALIGSTGTSKWVPIDQGSTGVANAGLTVAGGTNPTMVHSSTLAAIAQVGDRITLQSDNAGDTPHVTTVSSVVTTTLGLEAAYIIGAAVGDCTWKLEREINSGHVNCDGNPFISEDSDIWGWAMSRTDGPSPDDDTVSTTGGFRYRSYGGDPRDLAAYYCPFAPAQLISSVTLSVGTQCLDSLNSSILTIYQELFVSNSKSTPRSVNGCRDKNLLKKWALQQQNWILLLPFFPCTSYAKALGLVSICFHTLKLAFVFNPFTNIVVNGSLGKFTSQTISGSNDSLGTSGTAIEVQTNAASVADSITPCFNASASTLTLPTDVLAGSNFAVGAMIEYVYIGQKERDTRQGVAEKIVMIEHQSTTQNISSSGAVTTSLPFNHPVKAIFFTSVLTHATNVNDVANMDGIHDPLTFNRASGRDSLVSPLASIQIKFNSSPRTEAHKTNFYREIQNQNIAERVPDTGIFAYYYCVSSPYSHQMSGSANHSRLDRVDVVFTPQAFLFKSQILAGGANFSATTAAAGAASTAANLLVTIDVISINVISIEDCMVGKVFA
jgi:hypothetical protein